MNDQSSHEDIQSILRMPKREVWIITAATDSQRGGLVATYVSSGSINPETPTLVIAIAKNHFTRELIDQSNAFAAHLISAQQIELAWQFAIGSGRDRDKFATVDFSIGITSTPVLTNSLAYLECEVIKSVDAGDRIYYWAKVVDGKIFQDAPPLTDHELIAAATDEQLHQLLAGMKVDIEIQKPMFGAWVDEKTEK